MNETANTERAVYEASDGRKTILALAFLVLLPFLISLPIMFAKRSLHGLWSDALSAGVLALLFGAWMVFLLIQVLTSFRTRVEFNDEAVKVRVPNWRGPNAGFGFVKKEIPYDQIAAVETRGEIYQAAAVPVLTRASCIVLKDGERVTLGYVNEHDDDPDFDYTKMASLIAERANVPLSDKGRVVAGGHISAMRRGTPAWDKDSIPDDDYLEFRRRNHWLMFGMAIGLIGLAVVGVLIDIYRTGFYIGS